MPCLNEARTLPVCIRKAQRFLEQNGISGEVVVADNGSTDGSAERAVELKA
ncbi:MAG: glycosyltransferase, partial [Blastocatellia bacterium]|nr:glycosyltransferase [Blastocatellia bacterium]